MFAAGAAIYQTRRAGAELDILRGGSETLAKAEIVQLEVPFRSAQIALTSGDFSFQEEQSSRLI